MHLFLNCVAFWIEIEWELNFKIKQIIWDAPQSEWSTKYLGLRGVYDMHDNLIALQHDATLYISFQDKCILMAWKINIYVIIYRADFLSFHMAVLILFD